MVRPLARSRRCAAADISGSSSASCMRRSASSRERPAPVSARANTRRQDAPDSIIASEAGGISFLPAVLGKIIVAAEFAFEAPAHLAGRPFAGERQFEEMLLRRPGRVGLRLAVAPRHGVVEPAMRRAGVEMHLVGFFVGLERIAKAPDVVDRDQMIV